jgi:nicotinamidase-related amidase
MNKAIHALLLIDVQKGFLDTEYWGIRNNPKLEENISALLTAFRRNDLPILHVQHHSMEKQSPLRPDRPGVAFMDMVRPLREEMIFTKTVNSAFIGTSLEKYLRDREITRLTMAGLTSDHCVSTSARMAANLGFDVTVIEDAVATFGRTGFDGAHYPASLVHAISIASLRNEFASILSTQESISRLRPATPAPV